MPRKLSVTAFESASQIYDASDVEQNLFMRKVSIDFVDMIEQALVFTHPRIPPYGGLRNPKSLEDVQALASHACHRMRLILALTQEETQHAEED